MRVLGIAGSPHAEGNTSTAVRHALDQLAGPDCQTRFISLAHLEINPCTACFHCAKGRGCIFDDGMTGIYEALRWCEVLILGSPVYFGMVSGQLKTMMDRCVLLRPGYELPLELNGKLGAGIACANFRNGGQETTLQNIHTFLLQQGLRVINDGAGFSHAGGTIVADAASDTLGLQTIDNLAANIRLQYGIGKGATA